MSSRCDWSACSQSRCYTILNVNGCRAKWKCAASLIVVRDTMARVLLWMRCVWYVYLLFSEGRQLLGSVEGNCFYKDAFFCNCLSVHCEIEIICLHPTLTDYCRFTYSSIHHLSLPISSAQSWPLVMYLCIQCIISVLVKVFVTDSLSCISTRPIYWSSHPRKGHQICLYQYQHKVP
mgnify:CR=1 FL=1